MRENGEGEREAMLSPYAPEFPKEMVYTDRHCLYLTFSNGFPLTESQIIEFFNRSHAPFVADAKVYRPKGGRGPPLSGKVVFKRTLSPDLVMGNNEKVYLVIDGRPVFCRRFVTRQKTDTAATASNSLRDRDGESHHGD